MLMRAFDMQRENREQETHISTYCPTCKCKWVFPRKSLAGDVEMAELPRKRETFDECQL